MKAKIWILLILFTTGLSAQTIHIDFGFHPEKPVTLCLKNGTDCDTIFQGNLDEKGQVEISVPQEYITYRGMATIFVGEGSLDFIVAGEQPIISCPDEYPHGGNTLFSNSPENESLQKWFMAQAMRQDKISLLSEIERRYNKDDSFYTSIVNEKQSLETEQAMLEQELKESSLYAARFIQYYNFLNREVAGLLYADSTSMASVRTKTCDSLDINGLFTSGLWFSTLNNLLALYDNGTPYHKDFIRDMSLLLEKANSQRIYNTLSENLFAICEATGWNDMEEQLAYYLINSERIQNPTGRLAMMMATFKLGKGNKVPELTQGILPGGNTLLVFYESGCGPCENEMQQLKGNYPLLKERGYEVVSVSADTDQQIFRNTADAFPWDNKYCDFKGFQGEDFRNYGVIGTPTFYVIENGIIKGRFARIEDMNPIY